MRAPVSREPQNAETRVVHNEPRAAYIHVPFCRHRCGYCNFTLVAGRDDLIGDYLRAIELELETLQTPREVDTLYVEVLLPVEAFGKVKRGETVEVVPRVPTNSRHRAVVKVVDTVLDAASGTFGVRLELANPGRRIPAGIRCKASFPNIALAVAEPRKPAPAVAPDTKTAPQPKAALTVVP